MLVLKILVLILKEATSISLSNMIIFSIMLILNDIYDSEALAMFVREY